MDSATILWKFLLDLLNNPKYTDLIQWTGNETEFKLLHPEAVAQLWGQTKGNSHMTYDKLSRALRQYYGKNIIDKVSGQNFVYRFSGLRDPTCSPASTTSSAASECGWSGRKRKSTSSSEGSEPVPKATKLTHGQLEPLMNNMTTPIRPSLPFFNPFFTNLFMFNYMLGQMNAMSQPMVHTPPMTPNCAKFTIANFINNTNVCNVQSNTDL